MHSYVECVGMRSVMGVSGGVADTAYGRQEMTGGGGLYAEKFKKKKVIVSCTEEPEKGIC